jgi:hypothetical protein
MPTLYHAAVHQAAAGSTSMTMPILLLLLAAGAYCVMHRGTDWPGS